MLILGIETSCDETAISVVEDGTKVRSAVIASSKLLFERLTGVIPEEAARMQLQCIVPVLNEALQTPGCSMEHIDAIAVTKGPGLLGSLLIGTTTARILASLYRKPLIGVHHTLGHLCSISLECAESLKFPALALSVSGGHTELWLRENHTTGRLLGKTRDDAAGEAFDKGASLLGLPYPGGPSIAELARSGDPHAISFPLPLKDEDTLDFSFSGLKTSLRYALRDGQPASADTAASYEYAIVEHLLHRVRKAMNANPNVQELHIVGGVSANARLRTMANALAAQHNRMLRTPHKPEYCTDNASMIAAAAFYMQVEKPKEATTAFETTATLSLSLALH